MRTLLGARWVGANLQGATSQAPKTRNRAEAQCRHCGKRVRAADEAEMALRTMRHHRNCAATRLAVREAYEAVFGAEEPAP